MSAEAMPTVEVARIAVVKRLHGCWKNSVGDLHDEVVVRPHQAEAHATPLETCSHADEPTEELESVNVVAVVGLCCPDAVRPDVEHAGRDVSSLVGHFDR